MNLRNFLSFASQRTELSGLRGTEYFMVNICCDWLSHCIKPKGKFTFKIHIFSN